MTETRVDKYTPHVLRIFFERYHEFKAYVEKGDPSHVEVWVDVHDAIEDAQLSDKERKFLTLYYIDGISSEELAEQHSYSRQGIEVIIRRAMANIMTELTGVVYVYTDIKLR